MGCTATNVRTNAIVRMTVRATLTPLSARVLVDGKDLSAMYHASQEPMVLVAKKNVQKDIRTVKKITLSETGLLTITLID